MKKEKERHLFSGKLGFVLASAGASVGLGNIWRFPYLAAQYGGGVFLLIYIVLAVSFGYTMIVAETAIGRMTRKSPLEAFESFSKKPIYRFGGWITVLIPLLIVPYYSVIGGWVVKYLAAFVVGEGQIIAEDGQFGAFIGSADQTLVCFIVFALLTVGVIYLGVQKGIERISKCIMPVLVVLAVIICVYVCTRPGAVEGIKYFLIPNFANFSYKTVVGALTQMFYSLSIAMGILITFGSYMKKDISIEKSTTQVEIFDTAIAVLAGLMIIPAVFAYSGGKQAAVNGGPSLMFVTIPKVFTSMAGGTVIGVLFFALVLFAALTSSIALTECVVFTMEERFKWSRVKATTITGLIILALGTLSCLGYGPLADFKILGMQMLDLFDFLTNSVMMPIAAFMTCLLVVRVIGVGKVILEVEDNGMPFRRKKLFSFMIRWVCPIFAIIILIAAIAGAFGLIHI